MTRLQQLFTLHGQSPWLDNLSRAAQFHALIREGRSVRDTYWQLVQRRRYGCAAHPAASLRPQRRHRRVRISRGRTRAGRVDTEVDRRLEATGSGQAHVLRGRAAVAQAKLAYQLFDERLADERWSRLARLGAHPQRPLWASTSTKNPADPDTRYVDNLIGPDTVTTVPETTIAAFEDHGHLADTLDADAAAAAQTMTRLAAEGIDMDDVARTLEVRGIAAFHDSFQLILADLDAKAHRPAAA